MQREKGRRSWAQLGCDFVLIGILSWRWCFKNLFTALRRTGPSKISTIIFFQSKLFHHIKAPAFTLGKNSLIIRGGLRACRGMTGGKEWDINARPTFQKHFVYRRCSRLLQPIQPPGSIINGATNDLLTPRRSDWGGGGRGELERGAGEGWRGVDG